MFDCQLSFNLNSELQTLKQYAPSTESSGQSIQFDFVLNDGYLLAAWGDVLVVCLLSAVMTSLFMIQQNTAELQELSTSGFIVIPGRTLQ